MLLAYWLRFNLSEIPDPFLNAAVLVLPLVILVQGTVFWVFGLYRGIWRFASLPDLMRIGKAVLTGSALVFFTLFVFDRWKYVHDESRITRPRVRRGFDLTLPFPGCCPLAGACRSRSLPRQRSS